MNKGDFTGWEIVDLLQFRTSFASIEEWKVREQIHLKCVVVFENTPVPLLNDLQHIPDFDLGALGNGKPQRHISPILIEDVGGDVLTEVDEEFVESANVDLLVSRERNVDSRKVSKAIFVTAGVNAIDRRI